ncbi:cell division control protein 1-like [Daphnia pulicaria]|uniref:cell division control protein 1-like n=1 Tax=Daphnia pulicaria TaxID=35523 RepID=UPI001EEA24BE|nr:cell division control protein 1-like [Daphnia pulicaria]
MRCRLHLKSFNQRLKLFFFILCLTVFHNEYFVYWHDSMKWPHVNCLQSENRHCQRILIVSDPQILGIHEVLGWIAYSDSDRYLAKSFYYALHYIKPDVVVFLGDLMDEGSTSTDDDYQFYKTRFSAIFDISKFKSKIIYLPGDNDIGGEGVDHVTRSKIERFNTNFPNQMENISGNIQFVVVNRIIGDFSLPSVSTFDDKFRVVLSHIPLTFIPGIFSREVMLQLKPNVIFSAHDHRVAMATTRKNDSRYFEVGSFVDDSTVIKKQINDQDCTEVIWPTCSYRMGVVKSGYGFATIGNDGQMEVGVLWIHSRFWTLYLYLLVIATCLVLSVFSKCFKSFL